MNLDLLNRITIPKRTFAFSYTCKTHSEMGDLILFECYVVNVQI